MDHTPGAWRASARNVYSKELNTVIAQCWDTMIFTDEPLPVKANVNLIAAAPDLLAACEKLVEAHANDEEADLDMIFEAEIMAEAAIAAARGNR